MILLEGGLGFLGTVLTIPLLLFFIFYFPYSFIKIMRKKGIGKKQWGKDRRQHETERKR